MMPIAVDDVCTDAHLDAFLGGVLTKQQNLLPSDWASSEPAREYALRRTLQTLARRTPPIYESDISRPSELMDAVMFGAAARIYNLNITGTGDSEVMYHQARNYEAKWEREVMSLVITGPESQRIKSHAPSVMRR